MSLRINNIRDNNGARRKAKCLGRGIGSGKGKTSGRGGKGQTARSGVSLNGFEGGQTPLHRRLPKRGFVNIHRMKMYELDFFKINRLVENKLISEGQVVDRDLLVEVGYMPRHAEGISLIANGEIKVPVKLAVTRASRRAKEMLEKSGGSLVLE
ncbi:MAG: 50S ribosomal protein L15 [Holosporales bacterium]|nr:50S ribosomal protein L15 [Holosporales bacterium]